MVLPPLNKRFDPWLGLAVLAAVWWVARSAVQGVNSSVSAATQGAGEALSYLSASLNGWADIEMTPLMIRNFYLNDDYTLTDDARAVLWNVAEYRPLLIELFGNRYQPLKVRYRSLINVEITRESLQW
jgi:hypothetical protein